jgi:hypothetical protein
MDALVTVNGINQTAESRRSWCGGDSAHTMLQPTGEVLGIRKGHVLGARQSRLNCMIGHAVVSLPEI